MDGVRDRARLEPQPPSPVKELDLVPDLNLVETDSRDKLLGIGCLPALEQHLCKEAGPVGKRRWKPPEGRRLDDREILLGKQQLARLVEDEAPPQPLRLGRELITTPPRDGDHPLETGERFRDLARHRERSEWIDELEPVGHFDQIARQRPPAEGHGLVQRGASTRLLDRADAEQEAATETMLQLLCADARPLLYQYWFQRRIELAGDD